MAQLLRDRIDRIAGEGRPRPGVPSLDRNLDDGFVTLAERSTLGLPPSHVDLSNFASRLSHSYGRGREDVRGLGLEGKMAAFLDAELAARGWVAPRVREILRSERDTVASLAAESHRAAFRRPPPVRIFSTKT